jgi:hypothetical protein
MRTFFLEVSFRFFSLRFEVSKNGVALPSPWQEIAALSPVRICHGVRQPPTPPFRYLYKLLLNIVVSLSLAGTLE